MSVKERVVYVVQYEYKLGQLGNEEWVWINVDRSEYEEYDRALKVLQINLDRHTTYSHFIKGYRIIKQKITTDTEVMKTVPTQ